MSSLEIDPTHETPKSEGPTTNDRKETNSKSDSGDGLANDLLMECESEDEYDQLSEKNLNGLGSEQGEVDVDKDSYLKRILLDSGFVNDIELEYRNSDKKHRPNPRDSLTRTDIEANCTSKRVNEDDAARPKLLAKFKLISSSCNKPCTFEYSIKVEEESTEKLSLNDESSQQGRSCSQRSELHHKRISLKMVSLLNSLANINGQGYKDLDRKVFLSIKPLPLIWPKSSDLSKSLLKLENLVEVSSYKSNPFDWMVRRRLIVPPRCSNCKKRMMISDDPHEVDGIERFWVCGCSNMQSLNLPPSFSGIRSLRRVSLLIYCWSTRDENVETSLSVFDERMIKDTYSIYSSLQSLCGRIIDRDRTKLASFDGYPVEIVSVQIGNHFILAAMETKTKAIRLACFEKDEVAAAVELNVNCFVEKCRKWVAVPSDLLIFEKKFQQMDSFGYNLSYSTKRDFHERNCMSMNEDCAGGYVIQHMQRMFKNMNLDSLDIKSLTLLLNELEWREKYGYDPYTAFNNIITHLATDPINPENVIQTITTNHYEGKPRIDGDWILRNSERDSLRCGTSIDQRLGVNDSQTDILTSRSTESKDDEYYVDEFFYGWWCPLLDDDLRCYEKPKLNVLCHLCQMNFDKSTIGKHVIEHIEVTQSADTLVKHDLHARCNHCFRDFNPKQFHLHKEMLCSKMVPNSCRICCVSFHDKVHYLNHMKRNHWPREAPYACNICSYRSSFQKDISMHFDECHRRSKKILCPVCFLLINYEDSSRISELIYSHIGAHFKSGSSFSCSRCSLTFTNETHREVHLNYDHGDPSNFLQNFEFIPYRLSEKEVPLSTVSSRAELSVNKPLVGNLNGVPKDENHVKPKRLDYRIIEKICERMVLICIECKKRVNKKHFTSRAVYCRFCNSKTYCRTTAKKHGRLAYVKSGKWRQNEIERFVCSCGFFVQNFDDLATHMVISKHFTCRKVPS